MNVFFIVGSADMKHRGFLQRVDSLGIFHFCTVDLQMTFTFSGCERHARDLEMENPGGKIASYSPYARVCKQTGCLIYLMGHKEF